MWHTTVRILQNFFSETCFQEILVHTVTRNNLLPVTGIITVFDPLPIRNFLYFLASKPWHSNRPIDVGLW
jgi:hypothetical protein